MRALRLYQGFDRQNGGQAADSGEKIGLPLQGAGSRGHRTPRAMPSATIVQAFSLRRQGIKESENPARDGAG
jgi:hypothetical protein